jgi:polar amino acid transport system substrate-binding protein
MKGICCVVSLLMIVAAMCCGRMVYADTITLVSDQYPPYNEVPGSSAPGYAIEMAQRIFEKAGHAVVYQVVPWARAITETRQGTYTAIVAALPSDAPDFILPGNEIGIARYCFYTGKDARWKYTGIPSLAGKKIGVVTSYSYTDQLDRFFLNNPQVEVVSGDDAVQKNVQKLLAGRIDAFIENATVMASISGRDFLDKSVVDAGCQDNEVGSLYISFGPNNPKAKEYAAILSVGIDELRASGELQKILLKYGLTDWK